MQIHTATSPDGEQIYFDVTGESDTALLFVHGWLGNARWWDFQRDYFAKNYCVVQMDLAGHGRSTKNRKDWTVRSYAEDIIAVANKIKSEKLVLVGHSMSGSNVLEAAPLIKNTSAVIFVDTIHDLEKMISFEDAAPFFQMMQEDFKAMVYSHMAKFLFTAQSPQTVTSRILEEIAAVPKVLAINLLEPFYKTDMRETAKKVQVPVRAINSNMLPTNVLGNRKYLSNFDAASIPGVGHYPMLEKPDEFNAVLKKVLEKIGV